MALTASKQKRLLAGLCADRYVQRTGDYEAYRELELAGLVWIRGLAGNSFYVALRK